MGESSMVCYDKEKAEGGELQPVKALKGALLYVT